MAKEAIELHIEGSIHEGLRSRARQHRSAPEAGRLFRRNLGTSGN